MIEYKNVQACERNTWYVCVGISQFSDNCRKLWFDITFDTLNDQDKRLVKTAKTNKTFCFGDGVEVKAIKSVKFPATIGV